MDPWADTQQGLRILLENIPDYIMVLDRKGRFLYINHTAEGVRLQDVIGSSVFEEKYLPPQSRHRVQDALERVFVDGTAQKYDITGLGHHGRMAHYVCRLLPVHRNEKVHAAIYIATDISLYKQQEQALRESEQRYALAQRAARIGSWDWDVKRDRLFWSETMAQLFDTSCGGVHGGYQSFISKVHPDDRERVGQAVYSCLQERSAYHLEYRTLPREDGQFRWLSMNGDVTQNDNGESSRMLGVVRDITQQKQAESLVQRLFGVVEQTADAVMITTADGMIEYVNPAFESLSGYTAAEAVGQTPRLLQSGEHDNGYFAWLWHTLKTGQVFHDILVNRRKNGDIYYEEKTITPLKDKAGQITHYISTGKDVTEKMLIQEQMQYLAQHDLLTTLPNRHLFMRKLNQILAQHQPASARMAILVMDVDGFNKVNDTLGNAIGDLVLKSIAQRLRGSVRPEDTVARLSGDEFSVLMLDVQNTQSIPRVISRIQSAMAMPLAVQGRELSLTVSIGVSMFPDDGVDANALLRNADTALRDAKRQSNGSRFFTQVPLV